MSGFAESSIRDRSTSWSQLRREPWDLIVVGGGINGAGIAYDAAANGLRTLLIEKDDLGSGTTSWSSRLIHGGLRYLESFEIGLVRESLRERTHLLRMAPHLVEPLELTIPVYESNRHRLWKVRLGLTVYDLLSRDGGLASHRRYRRSQFISAFSSVRQQGLQGAVGYLDARVEFAERLCLEVAQAASRAGATVLTHSEVVDLRLAAGRIQRVTIRDRLHDETVDLDLGPDAEIFNAAGPWVDEVLSRIDGGVGTAVGAMQTRIGGVKGSHLLVDRFEGAPPTGLYVEASTDGRPFFILPWHGRLLIGTTEKRHQADLDRVSADDDEIDYLLAETNRVIPAAGLGRDDVRLCYAGVRALPAAEGGRLGRITRRHLIVDHRREGAGNLRSLVGGKLTTFRGVAEEVVDGILRRRAKPRTLETSARGLPGAWRDERDRIEVERACASVVGEVAARLLIRLYGARTAELLDRLDREPALAAPVAEGLEDRQVQIVWGRDEEGAFRLADLVCRRWLLPMRHPEILTGLEISVSSAEALTRQAPLLGRVASSVARLYGWSDARRDEEVMRFAAYARSHLIPGYRLAPRSSH